MDFVNQTPYESIFTVGYGKDGRERVIVVTKATFALPEGDAQEVEAAPEQRPLVEADEFEGDPGTSSPILETDFAHFKQRCDIFVRGSAHAGGRSAVAVGLRLGEWHKGFNVVGDRRWQQSGLSLGDASMSQPLPFDSMPITYGRAWGGTEAKLDEPSHVTYHPKNPAGVGYHPHALRIDGMPLPNTQHSAEQVTSPRGSYTPVSLGPIGRNWLPRRSYVGTYDDAWLQTRVPYLPDDFDERYYQGAPTDQQVDYPRGGESVVLLGMTKNGRCRFNLPKLSIPVVFVPHKQAAVAVQSNLDTILFEPDLGVVSMTTRAVYEARRDLFELRELVVGGRPQSALLQDRARRGGKTYYPSVADIPGKKPGT